jgi:uncharacterized protein YbjT (DUF2867 family)
MKHPEGEAAVFGGTGFIGSAAVRELRLRGWRVRLISRRAPREGAIFHRPADLTRPETLPPALEGATHLLQAAQFAGAPFENPRRGLTYLQVDGEGTINVVDAARRAGVQHIVYVSGAGAGENRPQPWFRAKDMAEEAVRGSGMKWTVFRPSWVYGAGDRSLNRFVHLARRLPVVPLIGRPDLSLQPLWVEDLALMLADSLEHPEAQGETFGAGGPEILTLRDILQTLLSTMRVRRRVVVVPRGLLRAAARLLRHLPKAPLTPEGIEFLETEALVSNELLLNTLSPRLTPLAAALSTYLSPPQRIKLVTGSES